LAAIAAEIQYRSIIDIGTDHAYIPIYTCQNGLTDRAIACDINPGPLEIAKKNINNFGLNKMIETRLCSGFDAVKPGEAECAVIAGMGGGLIIDIIKNAHNVVQALNSLILQPQLDIPSVRRYIHLVGYRITKECLVEDASKFYNVIVCEKGEDASYTEAEYIIGKKLIESHSETFEKYLRKQLVSLEKIKSNIKNAEGGLENSGKQRFQEIQSLIKMHNEILDSTMEVDYGSKY